MIPIPIPAAIKVPDLSITAEPGPGEISAVADADRARAAVLSQMADEAKQAQRLQELLQARRAEMQQLEDKIQEQKQQILLQQTQPSASQPENPIVGQPSKAPEKQVTQEVSQREAEQVNTQLLEAQNRLEAQKSEMQRLEAQLAETQKKLELQKQEAGHGLAQQQNNTVVLKETTADTPVKDETAAQNAQQLAERLEGQRQESQALEEKLQAQRAEIQRLEEERLGIQNVKIAGNPTADQIFSEQQRKAEEQLQKLEEQKQRAALHQLEIQHIQEQIRQLEQKRAEANALEGKAASANPQQSWAKYAYSDELLSGITDWAVKLHQLGGMARLESESRSCYENSGNHYRCLYLDLAARRIDAVRAGSFNSESSPYFNDANFGYRLTSVFRMDGLDEASVNSFLRSEAARVNVLVVQKINMSGFVN